MTTQRQRALWLVQEILPCELDIADLEDIVGQNQNEGCGEHDGSIGEKEWLALRDLAAALRKSHALFGPTLDAQFKVK